MRSNRTFVLALATCSLLLVGCGSKTRPIESSYSGPELSRDEVNALYDSARYTSAGLKKVDGKYFIDDEHSMTVKWHETIVNDGVEGNKETKYTVKQKGNIVNEKQVTQEGEVIEKYYVYNCPEEGIKSFNYDLNGYCYQKANTNNGHFAREEIKDEIYLNNFIGEFSKFNDKVGGYIRDTWTRIDENHFTFTFIYKDDHSKEYLIDIANHRCDSITRLDFKDGKRIKCELVFNYEQLDDIALPTNLAAEPIEHAYYTGTYNIVSDLDSNYSFNHRRLYKDGDNAYYVDNKFEVNHKVINLTIEKNAIKDGQEVNEAKSFIYYKDWDSYTEMVIDSVFGRIELRNAEDYGFLKPVDFLTNYSDLLTFASDKYDDFEMKYLENDYVLYTYVDTENNKQNDYKLHFDQIAEVEGHTYNLITDYFEAKVTNILTDEVEEYESFSFFKIGFTSTRTLNGAISPSTIVETAFANLEGNVEYTIKGATGTEKYDGYKIGLKFERDEKIFHIVPKTGNEYYVDWVTRGGSFTLYQGYSSGGWGTFKINDDAQRAKYLEPYTELLEPEFEALRALTLNGLTTYIDLAACQLAKGTVCQKDVATICVNDVQYHVTNPSRVGGSGAMYLADLPEFVINGETYTATIKNNAAINLPE